MKNIIQFLIKIFRRKDEENKNQKNATIISNLKEIGGDLNCAGNRNMSENSFPNLEIVRGKMIIAESGFTKLPKNLKIVGSDVIISKKDPASLRNSVLEAKQNGIILGEILESDGLKYSNDK